MQVDTCETAYVCRTNKRISWEMGHSFHLNTCILVKYFIYICLAPITSLNSAVVSTMHIGIFWEMSHITSSGYGKLKIHIEFGCEMLELFNLPFYP